MYNKTRIKRTKIGRKFEFWCVFGFFEKKIVFIQKVNCFFLVFLMQIEYNFDVYVTF